MTKKFNGRMVLPAVLLIGGLGAVIWLTITGDVIHKTGSREGLIAALWRHVGYGVALTPLVLVYLGWRFLRLLRTPFAPSALAISAGVVFYLTGAAIIFLALSGPIMVWAYGADLKVFDWFAIANPIGKRPVIYESVEAAHVVVAMLTPWLVAADTAFFAAAGYIGRSR